MEEGKWIRVNKDFRKYPRIKERPRYRCRYQMELVMELTGKKKDTIRRAIYYNGWKPDTEGFAKYLEKWIEKEYLKRYEYFDDGK